MNPNRSKHIAFVRKLIEGTVKRFPKATKLTVGSHTFTPPELVALFQEYLDACDADAAAQANAHKVKQALREAEAATEPHVDNFKTLLLGMFSDPTDLADFGVVPRRQPVPLTSEELALAAKRRKDTRKRRGTMGKRQRQRAQALSAQPTEVGTAAANAPPPKPNGSASG
jgi:hypothetical protein